MWIQLPEINVSIPTALFTVIDGLIVPAGEPLLGASRPTSRPEPLQRQPTMVTWDKPQILNWMTENNIDQ